MLIEISVYGVLENCIHIILIPHGYLINIS